MIAGGALVGVYDDLESLGRALRELKARGVRRTVVVRVGVDVEGWTGEWLGGFLNATGTRSR